MKLGRKVKKTTRTAVVQYPEMGLFVSRSAAHDFKCPDARAQSARLAFAFAHERGGHCSAPVYVPLVIATWYIIIATSTRT